MKKFQKLTMPTFITRCLTVTLSALLAFALVACGGGGVVPSGGVQQRTLSVDFGTRKAVSYSPFRTASRDTEVVTAANVLADLQLLQTGGFTLIRLFDSSDAVSKLVLQTIQSNNLDIKVMLGVWIQSGNSTAINNAEIARAVALANTYRSIVLALSVGNETMVNWSFNAVPVATMVQFITTVRNQVTQPVTTDDNWAFFAKATGNQDPKAVLNAIDFVAMHTYPLADSIHDANKWNWQQTTVAANLRAAAMMDAALGAAQSDFAAVRANMDSLGLNSMPIVVGETGWKAIASGGENYRAHPFNQKMYFDRLTSWLGSSVTAKPKAIFYFEAFDEPWKQADDNWGLFNVARKARYVVQSLYSNTLWEAGTFTLNDALYFIPTQSNGTVTASRYTVFADTLTTAEVKPTESILWVGWNSPATAYAGASTLGFAPNDGPNSLEITPAPTTWGWGLIAALQTTSDDLSLFATSGRLNFNVKTSYPGKIEVGFLTGTTAAGSAYDVYLSIDPANNSYGYLNDGNWHAVSIPINAITPFGAMAYGMTDASKSRLDLTKVTNPLVIADRYANTGKATNFGNTTKLYIDNVYWSK
jgi:exo-beta-1,3-glucanase (GH17 family)